MKNKSLFLGALIITLSIIIIGVSGSYSYFINEVVETNSANKGLSANSGNLVMTFANSSVTGTSSGYFKADLAGLVNDSAITYSSTSAHFTAFNVGYSSSSTTTNSTISYTVYLTDLTMTNNFKSSYVKWRLYKNNSSVASGDFSAPTLKSGTCTAYTNTNYDNNESLSTCYLSDIALYTTSVSKGSTDSYRLYIWLSNSTTVNQVFLTSGQLSGKVAFRATT